MRKLLCFISILLLAFSASAKKISIPKDIENASMEEMIKLITPLKGTTPAQWRLIWKEDPSKECTISWTTAEKGKKHTVHYGLKSTRGNIKRYQYHTKCKINGEFTLDKIDKDEKITSAFYHHVELTRLKPGKRYYFTIESDGETSREFYFVTADPKSSDFKLMVGGDSRSGVKSRCRMNLHMARHFSKDKKIIALAHGGDYVNHGRYWKEWRQWLSHHELTTAPDGRILPIIPTRGNHDSGPLFNEIFNFPKDDGIWYTTQLSKTVALVTLNTNVSGGGEQLSFLEGQLRKLRSKNKWLLTQYHRPLFPAVKSPANMAKLWVPVFEKYNLDLACESDGHCIKRTVPIRDGKADPTGVTYIGEGGLGVGQYKPADDRWYLKPEGKFKPVVSRGHHFMMLSFKPRELNIKTYLLSNDVYDDHTLKVRK